MHTYLHFLLTYLFSKKKSTWSHPAMTAQTHEEAVAEFYWALRAIKEATGVTPKCCRPPQGDVDDRIRSIA
jgi:peptidoglycan/xylan/chitin deacetylase (PgdA/CDA1 family)